MSKKRPSTCTALSRKEHAYWRGRLFRNSYTHNGRQFRVRAWCVKIQHRGQRKTFSLRASRKTDAAREAFELHQSIVRHGWNTKRPAPELQPHSGSMTAKTLPQPKLRLVQRPSYDSAASSVGLSVRVEHDGTAWYFPLGFNDTARAAKRAKEIYRTVQRKGWVAAGSEYPRELTVALHWAANPLVWTYATLHTSIELPANSLPPATPQKSRLSVALIEPDAGIGEALAACIDRDASFYCAAKFETCGVAFARLRACSPDLIMANHHMPAMEGPQLVERLRSLLPDCPCLLFSVYEDSVELFKSTPSGSAGYLLRRTPPWELLAPLAAAAVNEPLDAQRIARFVFKYFYDVLGALQSGPAAFGSAAIQKLTPRECQVLDWLSRGYVDKEIAVALNISAWTVHGHLKNIFEKLGVHSRTEAVVKYLQR